MMTKPASLIPPHDLDLERAVLAGALASGILAREIAALPGELFELDRHSRFHDVLCALAPELNGAAPDLALVKAKAERMGHPLDAVFLGGLLEESLNVVNISPHVARLRELACQRRLLAAARQTINAAEENRLELVMPQLEAYLEFAKALRQGGRSFAAPIDARAFCADPPREPAWLVQDLILEGANGWIGAGAKVGKSYLALDLALACALGRPWLEHFSVPRPVTVAFVEEEDSVWRVYQRLERLRGGLAVEPPDLLHVCIRRGLQLDDPASLDPFLRWAAAVRPAVIFWDVFNKLHTKNERQPEQMLPLLKRLDRIRDELGCANLVLHHARKPSPAGPDLASGGQKLRGPSEFWAWAENSLYLSPLAGKGHLRVEPESKDAQVEPFKVHLEDLPDGARRWVFDGTVEAKLDQGARNRQAIAEALRSGAQTASTLAPLIGVSERTIKTHLAALEGDGVVRSDRESGRAGRKFWTLTDPSPTWVTDAQS